MDMVFEDAPICDSPSHPDWALLCKVLEIPHVPLPESGENAKLPAQAELVLKHGNGNPLLFFGTYDGLTKFFIEKLSWENKPSELLPELRNESLFIIYGNSKGILLAPNVPSVFAHPDNPYYNAEEAATQGYKICIRPAACPFDLLKYGVSNGLLPDVRFPFPRGKEVWTRDWDFVARFFWRDFCEGD